VPSSHLQAARIAAQGAPPSPVNQASLCIVVIEAQRNDQTDRAGTDDERFTGARRNLRKPAQQRTLCAHTLAIKY